MCDGFIVAMGMAVVCQSGGVAGQQSEVGAIRVAVATEHVSAVEIAALGAALIAAKPDTSVSGDQNMDSILRWFFRANHFIE